MAQFPASDSAFGIAQFRRWDRTFHIRNAHGWARQSYRLNGLIASNFVIRYRVYCALLWRSSWMHASRM